ncbi:MAG: MBL fold metallo-hydrolase [Chloroflexota bacterium]
MAYTISIGTTRCHILSDGIHTMDGGGFFGLVPRMLWQRVIQPNEDNLIPTDARSLLIESAQGLILVDTGHGDKLPPKVRTFLGLGDRQKRLIGELARVGYTPEDIDLVLCTHLHLDHIGGNTYWAEGESEKRAIPTFPNARYMVQSIDLAAANAPNERTLATYLPENWQPLVESNLLDVVDGPQRLAGQVRTAIAPGHTDALQVVWVEDQGESLIFLGDACSWYGHMNRLAWVPSYDLYPMTSIETKRGLRFEIMEKNALMLFQHDGQVVTARLEDSPKGPQVVPEITQEPWEDQSL